MTGSATTPPSLPRSASWSATSASSAPCPVNGSPSLARADRWREGTFEEAVSEGVRQGRLQWMPFHWLKAVRGARL